MEGWGWGPLIRVRWIGGAVAPRCSWYGLSASDRPISNAKWVSNVIQILLMCSGLTGVWGVGVGWWLEGGGVQPGRHETELSSVLSCGLGYFRITVSLTRWTRLLLHFDCYPVGGSCVSWASKKKNLKDIFTSAPRQTFKLFVYRFINIHWINCWSG